METSAVTCPNCNAPIAQGNTCKYCGTVVQLHEPTSFKRSGVNTGQSLDDQVQELGTRLGAELHELHRLVGTILMTRMKRNFWAWMTVNTLGLWSFIKRPAWPDSAEVNKYESQADETVAEINNINGWNMLAAKFPRTPNNYALLKKYLVIYHQGEKYTPAKWITNAIGIDIGLVIIGFLLNILIKLMTHSNLN